jgi:hypothetical protein
MKAQIPSFLGIGTQKGGTTTLHFMLQQHPEVFMPEEKELHFYTLNYAQGVSWYQARFAPATLGQRCGEITPYYLFHPEAPRRIHGLLPKVRLIVLLRDPVERCLSGVFHSRRLGLEPLPAELALAAETGRLAGAELVLASKDGRHKSHQHHSYLSRSRYEQQLVRYEDLFSREQLLLLRSEDLFLEPESVWQQVLAFLELSSHPIPSELRRCNPGAGEAALVDPGLRRRLRQQLAETYRVMDSRFGLQW